MKLNKNCKECNSNDWNSKGPSPKGDKYIMRCKECQKTIRIDKDDYLEAKKQGIIDKVTDIVTETITDTKTNQYSNENLTAWGEDGKIMDIDAYCKNYGLPVDQVKSYKLVTHTNSPFYNIAFFQIERETEFLTEEYFKGLAEKYCKTKKDIAVTVNKGNKVVRGVYTDFHNAMQPNDDDRAMYEKNWGREEQENRINHFASKMIEKAIINKSSHLVVSDLGDFTDGAFGYTTRHGHKLPQTMNTEQQFETSVQLKVLLCDTLVSSGQFDKIDFYNCCSSNHGGEFEYIVNSAVKSILDIKYKDLITYTNFRRLMDNYKVGKHTFIVSHGKELIHSKVGFQPILSPKNEKMILKYMKEYKLDGFIEFSHGDAHRANIDMYTNGSFNYVSYPAFSPPSGWIESNFSESRSGYIIQIFDKNIADKEFYTHFF